MSNKKYEKGCRLERGIVNHAIEKGMVGIRSAGSHSPVDTIIFDEKHNKIYTIQCKSKKMSHKARERLLTTLPRQDEYLHIPLVITNIKEFKEFLKKELSEGETRTQEDKQNGERRVLKYIPISEIEEPEEKED